MKLFYSKTSPYSRKVRMMIHEKGLQQTINSVACNPFDEAPELVAVNPLGKIPVLQLDDGTSIYDSPVICDYLDTLSSGRLIPESGSKRMDVLCREALCDGVLDASYNIVMERRRDAIQQSADWITQWKSQIQRSVDHMETTIGTLSGHTTLAHLALGAALGYLDFRLPDIDWRKQHPALTAWYQDFALCDAMQATQPE